MNDSFLEDLDLVSSDVQNVNAYPIDRNVTTRATTSALQHLTQSKAEIAHKKIEQSEYSEKQSGIGETNTKESRKISEQNPRTQQIKVKICERKEKLVESKLKPIENKVKLDGKEQEIKENIKTKIRESKVKSSENKVIMKDRARRSASYKENTQISDVKENSKQCDSSKELTCQVEGIKKNRDKPKTYEVQKKVELKEVDATLLNNVKEIMNMCTKQGSSKVLRAMQKLYINSQANLIKHLLEQTDEIISEIHASKDSSRVRCLVEQNEKLQEDNIILQRRNEELQKKIEELENLQQENVALKLKCKELSKQ